jgi:hypothetical protein
LIVAFVHEGDIMRTVARVVAMMVLFSWLNHTHAQTNYYVNCYTGNNNWDGMSPTYSPPHHGPKKSIQAAILLANPLDTVRFTSGPYLGTVEISKNIILIGSNCPNIAEMKIDDGCTVTLKSDLFLWWKLTIESGVLVLDSSTLTVWNSSPDAVVIKDGLISGEVVRRIAGGTTQPYFFTDRHTRFTPDGNQGATELRIHSFPGIVPPNVNGGSAINRYYAITASDSLNGELCLAYGETELNGIPEGDMVLFGNYGSAWRHEGGEVDVVDNYVVRTNLTLPGSSLWTLGDEANPLPIQLASFTVSVRNLDDVQLDWITLTEVNNFGFFVQRRTLPSGMFADLPNSFVPGHGTTIEPHEYHWTDVGVAPGVYDYRLKQMDLDGTTHYTDSREVTISSPTDVDELSVPSEFRLAQNYPNPFNPSTVIQFSVGSPGFTSLNVFDILGKRVGTLFEGVAQPGIRYTVTFDATGLADGTYFYTLTNNGESSLKKMLLLK